MTSEELIKRGRTLSSMISMGERIGFGQDSTMIDALADRLEAHIKGAKKVLPLIEAAGREEVTDTRDWDEAEAMIRAAIGQSN